MPNDASELIPSSSPQQPAWQRDSGMCLLTRCESEGHAWLKKSLKPEFLGDAMCRDLLHKEAKAGMLISMDTPYVVKHFGFVDHDDECSIMMDFVEGETLADVLENNPTYFSDRRRTLRFVRQLLEGLKAIHHNQVVHLDLKPQNIMLTRVNHEVRIIDLGLCYYGAYQASMGMTSAFASPEQLDGSLNVDARSDIYSLGKVLERLPEKAKTKQLHHIISKCLQTDKEKRWQSAEDIIAYLDKVSTTIKILSAIACTVALIIVWSLFQQPVTGEDKHVLYGHFSLFSQTCAAVGKISNDSDDTNWQGNIYIRPEVRHWGMIFTVSNIADEAFMNSASIKTAYLPFTLRTIGNRAFQDCHNLIAISIPDGVYAIGEAAFCRTYKMENVTLSRSLHTIPAACFSKSAISTITIPEGVTTLQLDAFALCPKLQEVHLPSTLTTIERGVFWRCPKLNSINLSRNISIGEYAFDGTQIKKR